MRLFSAAKWWCVEAPLSNDARAWDVSVTTIDIVVDLAGTQAPPPKLNLVANGI